MNSGWIRAQDRKRSLTAAGSTVCLYAIAFLGAWLIGSLAPATLASVPGTVIVDLGGIEGPPGEVPLGLENAPDRPVGAPLGAAPLPAAAETPAQASAAATSAIAPIPEPPAQATPAKTVPPEPKAAPAPKPAPKAVLAPKAAPKAVPAPKSATKAPSAPEKATPAQDATALAAAQAEQERAAQEEAALRAAAASAAAAPAPPKTKTFGSGAPVASGGTGSAPGVSGGTGSVTFRGSEMGSALATTFGASSGQVGRNIYVPIYLYMPLPAKIDDSIYRSILAKETFRSYYQQSGAEWRLKSQAPLPLRGDFWTMLENAGYDASTADYRTGRKLSPVVLEFAVGPLSNNKVELVDIRLVSSSGSAEVDEAVMYGFRQASYFNKTGNAVAGKFVYGF